MRIGVDLGGTKIEALAMDSDGHELQRIRVATPKGDYDATVAAISGLVGQLEAAAGARASVGVGIPGTIVRATGFVKNANSTWLNGRPLEDDLSLALGRPVRCANDANCFAISEATDGAGAGFDVVFGVIIGTGCGGGLAIGGTIGAGPNGLRGEWGHTPLPWQTAEEFPGPACYCGRSGCLESWISGTGFEADYLRVEGDALAGPEIVAAAGRGDVGALAALERYEHRLGRALAMLADVLDPDAIVLGGGMSRVDRLYTGRVAEVMSDYAFGRGTATPILRNVHGDSSGVRGAAWLWNKAEQQNAL
jgi:fructokinase